MDKQKERDWPWTDGQAIVAGVTNQVIDKGADMLFWNQPIPSEVVHQHLSSNIKGEVSNLIRWENQPDGKAIYGGISANNHQFSIPNIQSKDKHLRRITSDSNLETP